MSDGSAPLVAAGRMSPTASTAAKMSLRMGNLLSRIDMADQVGQSGLLTESRLLAKTESGGFCAGDQERLLRMHVISNVAAARDICMLDEQGGPDDRDGITLRGAEG